MTLDEIAEVLKERACAVVALTALRSKARLPSVGIDPDEELIRWLDQGLAEMDAQLAAHGIDGEAALNRAHAETVRREAAETTDALAKAHLIAIADQYELLARAIDEEREAKPKG